MRQFNRKHDTIHWFSMGSEWTFNKDSIRLDHHKKTAANYKEGLFGSGHADTPLRDGKVPESWWPEQKGNGLAVTARQKKQYVGYPTQKPLALLQRIIRAASNEGEMILDPFCGCATACIAAEIEHRHWVGIDISSKAAELIRKRMKDELGLFFEGAHRTDIPKRTDIGKLPPYNCAENKKKLFGGQEGKCAGCDHPFPYRNFEVDHIIARNKGGTDHLENLQLLCGSCNRIKGDRGMEYLRTKLQL